MCFSFFHFLSQYARLKLYDPSNRAEFGTMLQEHASVVHSLALTKILDLLKCDWILKQKSVLSDLDLS